MSQLKQIRLPFSANLKLALVLLATLIAGGTLLYTQQLVSELRKGEQQAARFYASFLQMYANLDSVPAPIDAMREDLIRRNTITFPIIFTDEARRIQPRVLDNGDTSYAEGFHKNVIFDTTAPAWKQRQYLESRLAEMAEAYDPLPIYYIMGTDTTVFNYLYYDDSAAIERLRWLPFVEVTLVAMFIVVGYLGFSHIKRSEQSNIWVGMAKETAHQLGTPLSSLLGWIELLRMMPEDPKQVLEAADEMERDVERLNKVAHRFSKIGSAAELQPIDVVVVLERVVEYFERRLPHLGKKVTLSLETEGRPVYVNLNVPLVEWVFENLVRNAADAIDREDGRVVFRVRESRGHAIIDAVDNGRGIDPKLRKDIFRPGFSTKKRGWGLGLSLARRIIEEYHKGRITLRESSPSGTTFRIRLASVPGPRTPEERGETRTEVAAG